MQQEDTNNDIGYEYMKLTIRDLREWGYNKLADKLAEEVEQEKKEESEREKWSVITSSNVLERQDDMTEVMWQWPTTVWNVT